MVLVMRTVETDGRQRGYRTFEVLVQVLSSLVARDSSYKIAKDRSLHKIASFQFEYYSIAG